MRAARQKARVRLLKAIENYASMFGEAQRANGYRCAKPDDDALYQREMSKWKLVTFYKGETEKALRAYTRACRS